MDGGGGVRGDEGWEPSPRVDSSRLWMPFSQHGGRGGGGNSYGGVVLRNDFPSAPGSQSGLTGHGTDSTEGLDLCREHQQPGPAEPTAWSLFSLQAAAVVAAATAALAARVLAIAATAVDATAAGRAGMITSAVTVAAAATGFRR